METIGIVSAVVALLAGIFGLYLKIRDDAKKQANEFAVITKTFNDSVSKLNTTIAEINTTLKFYKAEIDRIGNRATTHGKELDELSKIVTLNQHRLEQVEKVIDVLNNRGGKHNEP